jgi:truncated hemoglobin YjbI
MYIWDYVTNFASYPQPFPNWNVLQPNMRSLIKNNVKGVFEQGCACNGYSTDLNELRCYLLSKLLWDADCDIERHKREFLEYYYGSAAPYIAEYMKKLTDKVEHENIHAAIFQNTDVEYLKDDMLAALNGVFDKAEKAVAGDALRLARVSKARLSLRWIKLKNKAMLKNEKDPEEINQFFTDWKAHGLTRIDEWVSAETTLRALLDGKWRGTEYYRYWWQEGAEIM